MDKKHDLRIFAKNLRKTLPINIISSELVKLLKSDENYKIAKNVMLFYPKEYEVNLLSILDDKKNFYFPRVKGEMLEVCPYKTGDNLLKSEFGVMEPCCDAVDPKILDLVIVPALMIDKNGYRLGYGGGFYDRFLNENRGNFKTITLLPKELYVENLPIDIFDKPVDKYIIY